MAWNKNKPAGSDSLKVSDDNIRANNAHLEEALNREHTFPGTGGATGTSGLHKFAIGDAAAQAALPGAQLFAGRLYIRSDLKQLQYYDGAAWQSLGIGVGVVTEMTGYKGFDQVTLTNAATITWNGDTQQVAIVMLSGNRTLGSLSNKHAGGTYILIVKQDGTGGRTLAYHATYKFPGGAVPVVAAGANDVSILTFVSDGTNLYGVAQLDFS